MTLGTAIKTIRTAAGIKQKELAGKIGTTSNYLSLVEHDKKEPSISFLRRLAAELEVPVAMFFRDHSARSDDRARLRDLMDTLVNLEGLYVAERRAKRRRGKRQAA